MEKYKKLIEECVTFKQLVSVVNKYDKRRLIDYLPFFLPYIIGAILIYVAVVLLVVFGIQQYIPQLILTFTIIFLLCGYGIYEKYFAMKIFKRARKKELEKLQ